MQLDFIGCLKAAIFHSEKINHTIEIQRGDVFCAQLMS